jgi:hypothetical protein
MDPPPPLPPNLKSESLEKKTITLQKSASGIFANLKCVVDIVSRSNVCSALNIPSYSLSPL